MICGSLARHLNLIKMYNPKITSIKDAQAIVDQYVNRLNDEVLQSISYPYLAALFITKSERESLKQELVKGLK